MSQNTQTVIENVPKLSFYKPKTVYYFRLKCTVYVLLFNNGFFQVDTKTMSTDQSDTTNFLIDSLSYLDEVEYCLRLKARWGRPTQLWPQSDS